MAHNRTRLEGFEAGESTSQLGADLILDGVNGTAYALDSTTKRTGSWSLRINPTSSTTACYISNACGSDGNPTTPNAVNALIFRAYLYFDTLPSATCRIIGTLDSSTNPEVTVTCSSGGVLSFDGVATATSITTGLWYRFEIYHDYVGASRILRLNGVEIASNSTAGDQSGQVFFGNSTTSATYDMYVDDVTIETSTDISNIDWPGEGGIYGVDFTGDGTHDSTEFPTVIGGTVWTVTDHPDTYLSVNRPYNADTSLALTGSNAEAKLTVTKETLATAGLSGTISCVQITSAVRANTTANTASRIMAVLSGTGDLDLSGTFTYGTTSYAAVHWLMQEVPSGYGGGNWTSTTFDAMEFGCHYMGSVTQMRWGLIVAQVEAAPESVTGGNSTVLTQLRMVTGAFWETTDYSPKIRTVQLTSEALGIPNEALNVIACSIRYIPWGAGDIRASYWMDYLTTQGFDLPSNPILYQTVGATTTTSTFEFSASTMVDEEQVYTKHFLVNQSGKFFQIEFTQTGSQPMRLLAMDLEVKTEGRREAYLDGGN